MQINININRLLKLESGMAYGVGQISNENAAKARGGEREWLDSMSGHSDFSDSTMENNAEKINKIKELHAVVLKCVEDVKVLNKDAAKNKQLIEIVEFKKMAKLKERNNLAKGLTKEKREELGKEMGADFSVIIN